MMKPRDAEKLLGGHAAGILTEAEKVILYAAALEHQELFDALADEEALRELLADPASRRHLLTLLEEPRARHPIPFWRRPATLGLAASLFAMVTIGLVLWQREHSVPLAPSDSAPESRSQKSSPAPRAPGPDGPEAKVRPMASEPPANPTEKIVSIIPPGAPPPDTSRMMKAAGAPPPAAMAEAVESAAAPDKSEATAGTADARESLERLPASRAMAERASLGPGARGLDASIPAWTLEPLEDGNLRVTITWTTGRHLYLLHRTASGIQLLAPRASIPGPGGTMRSTFETPLESKDHLDLYLLPQPEADPKGLPPTGMVDGFHQRLR